MPSQKLLKQRFGVEVLSYVKQVRKIVADINPDKVKLRDIESNIVRCPDTAVADKMIHLIDRTRKAGDTVGGIIEEWRADYQSAGATRCSTDSRPTSQGHAESPRLKRF